MIDRSHGGNVWQYPESLRRGIVDFSVNTNPLGASREIKKRIIDNIDKIDYYPDPESGHLRNSLAKFHRLSSHNFLVGNGSIELIHIIPRALEARSVLIPTPTFREYEFAARANGAKCLYVNSPEGDDFKIDVSRLMRYIPKVDMVFLCNPNNPTGSVLERMEISSLSRECKKYGTTLVIDEAFIDFVDEAERSAMDAESAGARHLLVIRSLTKFFVLPGIRIGYVVGHKDTISKLSRHTYPWNVNTIAQFIAVEAINNKRYIARTQSVVPEERAYLRESLETIGGVKVYPSSANFLLCKLTGAGVRSAADLFKKLMRLGILIRRCHNFRGLDDSYFRIAVKGREANMRLISAVRTILK